VITCALLVLSCKPLVLSRFITKPELSFSEKHTERLKRNFNKQSIMHNPNPEVANQEPWFQKHQYLV
jgi:hypothetical protein